jgi:uncharacterized protein DUF4339
MPRLWRYKRDGQEFGPVTPDDLKMLAKSQRLGPTDLVCKDGTNHWFPARGIQGLFPRPGLFGKFVGWFGTTGCVILLLAVVAVGVGVGFIIYAIHNANTPAPSPPPAVHHHKRLLSALHEMHRVRDELEGTTEDYGRHIKDVRDALREAIKQTEAVLLAAGVSKDDLKDDPDAYKKDSEHPHLDHAFKEVVGAYEEIEGSSDFPADQRKRTLDELHLAETQLQIAMDNAKK